jgi:hypothetical protein
VVYAGVGRGGDGGGSHWREPDASWSFLPLRLNGQRPQVMVASGASSGRQWLAMACFIEALHGHWPLSAAAEVSGIDGWRGLAHTWASMPRRRPSQRGRSGGGRLVRNWRREVTKPLTGGPWEDTRRSVDVCTDRSPVRANPILSHI